VGETEEEKGVGNCEYGKAGAFASIPEQEREVEKKDGGGGGQGGKEGEGREGKRKGRQACVYYHFPIARRKGERERGKKKRIEKKGGLFSSGPEKK